MTAWVGAGAGFLLAVLWFDLMFDVLVLGHPAGELAEPTLASIAAYYRRVTTTARPMNRLVAAVMVAALAGVITELARGHRPLWTGWASLALVGGAVALAGAHTVPSAVRLGARSDPPARQSELARAILRDHVICACAIAGVLVVQLAFA